MVSCDKITQGETGPCLANLATQQYLWGPETFLLLLRYLLQVGFVPMDDCPHGGKMVAQFQAPHPKQQRPEEKGMSFPCAFFSCAKSFSEPHTHTHEN